MSAQTLGLYPIDLEMLQSRAYLAQVIYPNMQREYYWSADFSPEFYIAQAKAGFMAICETIDGEELLLPEIQRSYALLHFEDLHISKNVARIIRRDKPVLHFSSRLDEVAVAIRLQHKQSWLTPRYQQTLQSTYGKDDMFSPIAVSLKNREGELIAGEIGYFIGSTYTSLSGFSSREKRYRDYGKVQMVLLAQKLQEKGVRCWNLGHPYMPYKTALGAKVYTREAFLKQWYQSVNLIDTVSSFKI